MPVEEFDELINGKDIYSLVKSMHKLRGKKREKKRNSFLTRLNNVKKRFFDIVIDRREFFLIFFLKQVLIIGILDFNLNSETEKFDFKITFFTAHFIFGINGTIMGKFSFVVNPQNVFVKRG